MTNNQDKDCHKASFHRAIVTLLIFAAFLLTPLVGDYCLREHETASASASSRSHIYYRVPIVVIFVYPFF
uniref:Sugar transporter n=1 Tax=Solanum tuberosum TaxID=4113 RepID=M1BDC8_SOLTU